MTMFDESRALLPGIVDAMLPRFSIEPGNYTSEAKKLGVHFRLRMDLNYFGEREDISKERLTELTERYLVEYVVIRPNNYTKVFVRHGESHLFFGKKANLPKWMFVADHDCCWREAFDIPMHIYFERREPFLELGLKYHEISEHASFDLNGQPKYVLLEKAEPVTPISRQDRDYYHKKHNTPHELTFRSIPIHKIFPYLREYQKDVKAEIEA